MSQAQRSKSARTYIRYFVPEDGDSEAHPNVFAVPASGALRLHHVVKHFPLPGTYFFRFKAQYGQTYVWVDVDDMQAPVPVYRKAIVAKVSRLSFDAPPASPGRGPSGAPASQSAAAPRPSSGARPSRSAAVAEPAPQAVVEDADDDLLGGAADGDEGGEDDDDAEMEAHLRGMLDGTDGGASTPSQSQGGGAGAQSDVGGAASNGGADEADVDPFAAPDAFAPVAPAASGQAGGGASPAPGRAGARSSSVPAGAAQGGQFPPRPVGIDSMTYFASQSRASQARGSGGHGAKQAPPGGAPSFDDLEASYIG